MHLLGSSSSNIALDSPEPSPLTGRKRQRSRSMQSDSAASTSSAKRSAADNSSNDIPGRSPRTDQSSTAVAQDIDAYMAEQGEADIPPFMGPPSYQDTNMPPVSREEKFSIVEKGKGRKMEVGETWYLVSSVWYKRWSRACTGQIDKEGPVTEEDLGPVNNSALLDSYGNLLHSLAEGVDVEYIPEEVWTLLVQWYGTPIHPLPRRIIARGIAKLPAIELHPLRFKVFRLVKDPIDAASIPQPWLTISSGETVAALCTKLSVTVAQDSQNVPYRVWKIGIAMEDTAKAEFAASQLSMSDAKIIDESQKTLEEESLESDDAFVVEYKQPDGWIAEAPKTAPQSSAVEGPRPLFGSNDGFFDKLSTSLTPSTSTTSYKGFYNAFASSASKMSSTSTSLTTNKSLTKNLEPGTLGLGNMGNTCFMNSALQCLAHTRELSDYFLSGVFEDELNRDNPLGMGGAIAEAFGALLTRIWASSGVSTSYSPRDFKSQLQRFAPQFSGYQQHDSQELVAFLLDGLHEDLNRVIKKPYVEKPDWEGGGDLEMVQLAKKSWEGYMLRNDSIIVDLFQGQYQSTLVCPECQKVSITFDPFMYLTLPLPVQKKWKHAVFYVPWDLEKPHVKVPVEINRDASFKDLRQLLGRWMNAPPENILTMEIFSHKFYKNLDDNVPVGDLNANDTIVCFELPCNARQSRTYKPQPNDPAIIPVYLCDAKASFKSTSYGTTSYSSNYFANTRGGTPSLFGYPMVIAVDQEQAKSLETMYELVVTRLQRWTANAQDLFAWEAGEEIPIRINGYPPIETITEITEDGDVVTLESTAPPEGDIVDEKSMIVDGEDDALGEAVDVELRKVGVKQELFNLRLQVNHKDLGTAYNAYMSNNRWESWDARLEEADSHDTLLREDDAFYCEFDEDKKSYFFGEGANPEHALWGQWDLFTHPEYEESKKASLEKRSKGISLQDCLDEFTKEEQLGEDDLWYCPQCKKHQQATKKFDLWKVPDILVVHLKRFSNNRSLRDKIDTHIDFPTEGLDLGSMVGERQVARRLLKSNVDIEELKLGSLDEPLVYDLFAVDEHMGGLGGGHYRAYASNHRNEKWYHFDDSYVSQAGASDSVNANAYLLFYRRRSNSPLGGKSFQKIQEARQTNPAATSSTATSKAPVVSIGTQLPTPPSEPVDFVSGGDRLPFFSDPSSEITLRDHDPWTLRSGGSNAGSSVPSPPTEDPPEFDDYPPGSMLSYPLQMSAQRFDFPDPNNKASPTSSNGADVDIDLDRDDSMTDMLRAGVRNVFSKSGSGSAGRSPEWDAVSNQASPSYSEFSDDPFSDANVQKPEDYEVLDTNTNDHDHHEQSA